MSLRELIDATPWVDTHEHLVEEHRRLGPSGYEFIAARSRARHQPRACRKPATVNATIFSSSCRSNVSISPAKRPAPTR